jgi:hypothetical protein
MLLARERPPVRLSVNVETPSGYSARWGADDPSPQNQPQGLTISSTMPGGFESFGCTLQRDPRHTYPDLEELSTITVSGLGGAQIAWQGRLEQLPDTGGSQAQVSPAGSGYQNALQDNNSAAMIYVDQSLGSWQGPSLGRQVYLVGESRQFGTETVGNDPAGNPAIILEIDDSWVSPFLPIAEAWYNAGTAGTIGAVYYNYSPGAQISTSDTNWGMGVFLSPDDLADGGYAGGEIALGGATGVLTGAFPYALIQQSYGSTPAGQDGASLQTFWRLAVVGNHGLAIQGSWPSTIGVLASDVAGQALGRWAPEIAFTTGPNGTVQPSQFVIPQLAFTTPTTASAIVQQIVQYELLDWAVWEGPQFWMNPLGESARTRNWRARMGECQLQDAGPDITRLLNGVLVQFTNVDGTSGTVGPPGSSAQTTDPSLLDTDPQNPANQAGIDRWGTLQMGTTTPAAAIQVGARYLEAQAVLNTAGQASLVGHCQDDNGVYWPAWMVRAGDTLTVVDAADTSARRITSSSYADATKTNALTLGQPPDSTVALLERLSAVIQPLGLS